MSYVCKNRISSYKSYCANMVCPFTFGGTKIHTYLCHLFQFCSYNMRTWGFVRSGHFAGSFLKTNPLVSRYDNAQDDLLYKDICCFRSDLCDLYYKVRPVSDTCYSVSPFILFGKTYFRQMSLCMLFKHFNSSINTIVNFDVVSTIVLNFAYITL